jgi:hypothetical protein
MAGWKRPISAGLLTTDDRGTDASSGFRTALAANAAMHIPTPFCYEFAMKIVSRSRRLRSWR